ncbi:gamma-glutamyl-gamma-aminobutyrate hydrolase family protein, partial [Bacillus licheniformis]|nr:gamma-glutamyl-gamma-aminobutyrate hydrolase family protein [Bacillus licheniformis]
EILTDPSYSRQIVTLTYPHIGNVGVNAEDVEATKVHAAGLIIRDLPTLASNFRMDRTLGDYLRDEGVVAIAGIDTRKLTRILRMLAERGCHVTVLPAQASAEDALALNPDGVFLSNGPGDPEPCDYAIAATKAFIERGVPTFGICLGHQIMGLAVGAKTLKMKTGHHGANHPVKDLGDGRVV